MTDKILYGIIVDNADPLKNGRCKTKIIGKYDSLPNSDLPWIQTLLPCNTLDSPVGPPIGSQVMLMALDDYHQQHLILGVIPGISQDSHDCADVIRNDSTPEEINIKSSNNISSFEPKASDNYGTVYPYSRGYKSLSGSSMICDDTPSKERIDIFHKSGSYLEFTNSSTIFKSNSDLYQINSGNYIGYSGGDYNLDVKDTFTATATSFKYNGDVFINDSLYFTQCYGTGGSTINFGNNIYVTGSITATGSISGGISDERLKIKLNKIDNALEKVLSLEGFIYKPNEKALEIGVENVQSVGLSAQTLQKVLPEAVRDSAFEGYLTIQYEKVVPLLIEAFKELHNELQELKVNYK